MRRTTRILTATLALSALTGLSACGDTTDDESTDTTTAESGDTGGGAPADCSTPGETVTVEIPEFAFEPDPIEISACDEVVWKNTHDQPHTSTGNGDQSWSTGNLQTDAESDPVAFEAAGSYTYMCALHPFMKGTVEVS